MATRIDELDDYLDTPGMNEVLDDLSYRDSQEYFAIGGFTYDPKRGHWVLMHVSRDGKVHFDYGLDRRTIRHTLQLTASLVGEQQRSRKTKRFEPLISEANRPKRRALSIKTRWEILERDGHRCAYCGRGAPDVRLHIDHRQPASKGGSSDPANLVTSCQDCNLGKNDRDLT